MSDVEKNIGTHKPQFAGEWVRLGDVCEITMGQSPDSSSYNADCEGLPFYQGNADFGETHPMPMIWCSEPKKVAEPGDVLISVRAPVGAINVADERCCIGRGLAAVRPSGSDISNAFLALILQSKRAYLDSMSTGSTFKAIGKKVLSSCEVPLYSHEVQNRIACQINGIDDCLRSSRKLLSALDGLVKSQFMEMFSECLGDKVSLSDVVWFQEGPGVRNYQYTAHGVKLLNVANLHDGELDISNTGRYISEEEAYGRYRHFLVEEGDLIIASSGIKVDYFDQKMGFAKKEQLPLCMNTSTIRFRAIDSRLNMIFFMYYLKSDDFKQQLARQITGSAQLNFGPSHLKKMSVPMPPFVLQQQFADFVAQVDKLGFGIWLACKSLHEPITHFYHQI